MRSGLIQIAMVMLLANLAFANIFAQFVDKLVESKRATEVKSSAQKAAGRAVKKTMNPTSNNDRH
jgi:Tfp pilus assembly protein FimT